MKIVAPTVLTLLIAGLGADAGRPDAVCSADTPLARSAAEKFLTDLATSEPLLPTQAQVGLEGTGPPDIELVTQSNVCAHLRNEFKHEFKVQGSKSPYVATYYQVEDRYVVTVLSRTLVDPPTADPQSGQIQWLGDAWVFVYDLSFTQLALVRV